MIEKFSIKGIVSALEDYKSQVSNVENTEDRDDYDRLIAITEKLIRAVQANNQDDVHMLVLGFSRQVSDSYAMQPDQFKPLAEEVRKLKSVI